MRLISRITVVGFVTLGIILVSIGVEIIARPFLLEIFGDLRMTHLGLTAVTAFILYITIIPLWKKLK